MGSYAIEQAIGGPSGYPLDPDFYHRITSRMIDRGGAFRGTAIDTQPAQTGACRLGREVGATTVTTERLDATFSAQLSQLLDRPELLGDDIIGPPEAYVLTANSAIPIADAIRGYFTMLGWAAPPITYISTKLINPNSQRTLTTKASRAFPEDANNSVEQQFDRLYPVLQGMTHVTLVDQYVASGSTLATAAGILELLGINQITAIRGNWYAGVYDPSEVDRTTMTSTHAEFMRDVGAQACLHIQTTKVGL